MPCTSNRQASRRGRRLRGQYSVDAIRQNSVGRPHCLAVGVAVWMPVHQSEQGRVRLGKVDESDALGDQGLAGLWLIVGGCQSLSQRLEPMVGNGGKEVGLIREVVV